MSEELVVRHCSPTLAGMKTGSLFSCTVASAEELRATLRAWNDRLRSKGLRIVPLRYRQGRALIYVFRPESLRRDLDDERAGKILSRYGYPHRSVNRCILRLITRIKMDGAFPHEIGLFLGYPPEDVSGFIDYQACGYKCVGCWKVYGDVEAAQRTFAKYKKCTDIYCKLWSEGRSIERLTVVAL